MKHLKKPKLLLLSFVIIALTLFQGCSEESITEQEQTESNALQTIQFDKSALEVSQNFDNNTFLFKVKNSNNVITSTFSIVNNNKIIYKTDFSVNTARSAYKVYQANKVIRIANDLNFDLNLADYTKFSEEYKSFMDEIFQQYGRENIKLKLNSVFFHNSILNSKKRSLEEENETCDCTLHPGYLVDKTGFYCQEDYYMKISNIKAAIQSAQDENLAFLKHSSSKLLINYINNTQDEYVRFDKVYSFFVEKDKFIYALEYTQNYNNNGPEKGCGWWCPLGCGTDWGCCGNYSGCCWYWDILCYIHDKQCTNCTPSWYCLPGCVPD